MGDKEIRGYEREREERIREEKERRRFGRGRREGDILEEYMEKGR